MALVDTDPDLRMKLSDVNYRRLAGTGRTSAAYDDNSNRIRGRQRGRNYLGDKERSQERVDEQKKREQQDELSTYKGRHDSRKVSNNSRFETNSPMQMKAYS